jgi:hypothetical protein
VEHEAAFPYGIVKIKFLKGDIFMKKTLVLAMAMALGVSATAFAANPFSDVPAGHWAYASVAKLAAAGVVDGYPDGTFKGNNLMTRYEMAQIVAKALAKGAIGSDDKLVGEFADELDNLGVRVAKLEKKSDNVKITGNIRATYANLSGDDNGNYTKLRSRLFFTGAVNDNWNFVSMIQNDQDLNSDSNSGDENTTFQRAYLQGKIGSVGVTAGRYEGWMADGNIYDTRTNGIKLDFGKGVKFTAEAGKMANATGVYNGLTGSYNDASVAGKYYRGTVAGNVGALALEANYVSISDVRALNMEDDDIYTFGAKYNTGDLSIGAIYLKGDSDYTDYHDMDDDGYVVSLGYGAAKASKVGSLGVWANYYNQGASTVIAHTMNGTYSKSYGLKGYGVGIDYTVAKNMVAGIQYFDLKDKDNYTDSGNLKHKTLWSQLIVTF